MNNIFYNDEQVLLKAKKEFPDSPVTLHRPSDVDLEQMLVYIPNWDDNEAAYLLSIDELEEYETEPPVSIAHCKVIENYAPEFGEYTLVVYPKEPPASSNQPPLV